MFQCSHECGWGVQRRPVMCVSYSGAVYTVVADAACGADARPAEEQRCGGPRSECAARWHVSEWGSCAGGCGAARQSRTVACLSAYGAARTECPTEARPDGGRSCLSPACGKSGQPATIPSARMTFVIHKMNDCRASELGHAAVSAMVYPALLPRSWHRGF